MQAAMLNMSAQHSNIDAYSSIVASPFYPAEDNLKDCSFQDCGSSGVVSYSGDSCTEQSSDGPQSDWPEVENLNSPLPNLPLPPKSDPDDLSPSALFNLRQRLFGYQQYNANELSQTAPDLNPCSLGYPASPDLNPCSLGYPASPDLNPCSLGYPVSEMPDVSAVCVDTNPVDLTSKPGRVTEAYEPHRNCPTAGAYQHQPMQYPELCPMYADADCNGMFTPHPSCAPPTFPAVQGMCPSWSYDHPISHEEHPRCRCQMLRVVSCPSSCDVQLQPYPRFQPAVHGVTSLESAAERKARRKIASIKERCRLRSVNAAMQVLKRFIPFEKQRHHKMSKLKILRFATEYIRELSAILADDATPNNYPACPAAGGW